LTDGFRNIRSSADIPVQSEIKEVVIHMRTLSQQSGAAKGKLVVLALLYALSFAIIMIGAGFSVYSALHGVKFAVMSTNIPGAVFGMVILFLGIRYFFSLSKLKEDVFKSTGFSWENFRKGKRGKA
jgi:hypothetical protein